MLQIMGGESQCESGVNSRVPSQGTYLADNSQGNMSVLVLRSLSVPYSLVPQQLVYTQLCTLTTPISVGANASRTHNWREFSASLLLFKVRLQITKFSATVVATTLAITLPSHEKIIHNPHTFGVMTFQFCKILTTSASSGNAWSLMWVLELTYFVPTFPHVGYKDSGHLRLIYLFPQKVKSTV